MTRINTGTQFTVTPFASFLQPLMQGFPDATEHVIAVGEDGSQPPPAPFTRQLPNRLRGKALARRALGMTATACPSRAQRVSQQAVPG